MSIKKLSKLLTCRYCQKSFNSSRSTRGPMKFFKCVCPHCGRVQGYYVSEFMTKTSKSVREKIVSMYKNSCTIGEIANKSCKNRTTIIKILRETGVYNGI